MHSHHCGDFERQQMWGWMPSWKLVPVVVLQETLQWALNG